MWELPMVPQNTLPLLTILTAHVLLQFCYPVFSITIADPVNESYQEGLKPVNMVSHTKSDFNQSRYWVQYHVQEYIVPSQSMLSLSVQCPFIVSFYLFILFIYTFPFQWFSFHLWEECWLLGNARISRTNFWSCMFWQVGFQVFFITVIIDTSQVSYLTLYGYLHVRVMWWSKPCLTSLVLTVIPRVLLVSLNCSRTCSNVFKNLIRILWGFPIFGIALNTPE